MKKINNKGYTLIEVLAVIIIIAVVGMIAIPNVLTAINAGKTSSYDILIDNIKIGGQQLFEEIDNTETKLFHYNNDGKTTNEVKIYNNITPDTNETYIEVNLQTLVSNGFLVGTNRDDTNITDDNKNSKVIINPIDDSDIGACTIKITKTVAIANGYKTSYTFTNESQDKSNCPTDADYK